MKTFQLEIVLFVILYGLGCGPSHQGGSGNSGGSSGSPGDAGLPGASAVLLSQTGLYANIATKQVADGVLEYEPGYALWSDGAKKTRWVLLPAGTRVDSTDMDHWRLPVGAKLFKEFAMGATRVETRILERIGAGNSDSDYFLAAYIWRADQSDADLAINGGKQVLGTTHDVPTQTQCGYCHQGEPGRALGFSAIQLSGSRPGLTLARASTDGHLTMPATEDYPPPGPPAVAAALGYLNANCGHCHNQNGIAWQYNQMILRLVTAERTPQATQIYGTTINNNYRVVPGDPASSDVIYRMQHRSGTASEWAPPRQADPGGNEEQMPPIATDVVDQTGLSAVSAWIAGL